MKRLGPPFLAPVAMSLAATLVAGAAAQEPKILAFEVASVRPNRSGDVSMDITRLVGNDFSVVNAPLRDLIKYAYEVADYELVGAPDWASRDRFDIQAKGPASTAAPSQPAMRWKGRRHQPARDA